MFPCILIWIGLGLLGGYIAAHKGYPPLLGILAGIFAGPTGLIVAALLPRTRAGDEQAAMELETQIELSETRKTQACPKCGRQNSVNTRACPRCEYRLS